MVQWEGPGAEVGQLVSQEVKNVPEKKIISSLETYLTSCGVCNILL